MVAMLFDPAAAPLLPALSVAVQLTLLVPWTDTVSVPLALMVPMPESPLTVAPKQLTAVTLLPPVVVSLAVIVPVTAELTNQPF